MTGRDGDGWCVGEYVRQHGQYCVWLGGEQHRENAWLDERIRLPHSQSTVALAHAFVCEREHATRV